MGVLKFRITPPDLDGRLAPLRKAYVTGLDRTPERLAVDLQPGLMTCRRESPESGRVHVPWRVEGVGMPYVGTATLVERAEPYDLAVELARGKLNDVRNQAADWSQMGLKAPAEIAAILTEAHRAFARAATAASEDPAAATAAAAASLDASFRAGRALAEAYTRQVLHKRLEHTHRLHTRLACDLEGDPRNAPWADPLGGVLNAARVQVSWGKVAPAEGQFRWEAVDAQINWCRKHKLMPMAGPLIDFRAAALPDWLWLLEGDADALGTLATDLVREAVARYKGKIAFWHLVARPASAELLGLSEDEQIRLTARVLQVARQVDPSTQMIIDFDRPWAEWMASGPFQLGPLHLADSLSRADLGLSGIGIEVACGYGPPGSHLRDLFDFSRLLDLYALLNLPLHVSLVAPSSTATDPLADPAVSVEADQWPGPIDEATQAAWAMPFLALAVAKPFVRSVNWLQPSDSSPHLYPFGGLFRADGTPKPLLDTLRQFREVHLL